MTWRRLDSKLRKLERDIKKAEAKKKEEEKKNDKTNS